MLLPLSAAAIMAAVLLWELALPRVRGSLPQLARTIAARRKLHRDGQQLSYDPGRELRAEQRARELLRSCVNEEEWAMYRDLGFLRVWAPERARPGRSNGAAGTGAPAPNAHAATRRVDGADVLAVTLRDSAPGTERALAGAPYAYLLYPHKPIVAYVPQTGTLLNEYCVAFPDETRPYGSARLPDADDVLAKWMALAADERRLIADANMHLPGRQIDPQQVREDLVRLARWERERAASARHRGSGVGAASSDGVPGLSLARSGGPGAAFAAPPDARPG